MSTLKMRRAACAIGAMTLLAAAPLAAAQAPSANDAEQLCGGDKGGKDVKKPKGDEDEKRPTNPASAITLCGGEKGGKDVKKPKGDEDEKRPTNPAAR